VRAFAAFLIVASTTAAALVVVATAGEPRHPSAAPTPAPERHLRAGALLARSP